jgi:quinol monooxygenase YgiN
VPLPDAYDITAELAAHDSFGSMALPRFAKMRPMCLGEPGCVSWDAYHSEADPQRLVLVERWESEDAWRAHGELASS